MPATYSSEFKAVWQAVEQIIDLALHMLRVPIDGPSLLFGDNKALVTSATAPIPLSANVGMPYPTKKSGRLLQLILSFSSLPLVLRTLPTPLQKFFIGTMQESIWRHFHDGKGR